MATVYHWCDLNLIYLTDLNAEAAAPERIKPRSSSSLMAGSVANAAPCKIGVSFILSNISKRVMDSPCKGTPRSRSCWQCKMAVDKAPVLVRDQSHSCPTFDSCLLSDTRPTCAHVPFFLRNMPCTVAAPVLVMLSEGMKLYYIVLLCEIIQRGASVDHWTKSSLVRSKRNVHVCVYIDIHTSVPAQQ